MTFQTYNLGVPNPPNRPSSDVPLMQVNTNSIPPLIVKDHYGFNDSSGGWHKQVTLPVLPAGPIPIPVTQPLQGAVYTKNVGGGVTQLFYRRENNGSEIQITSATGLFNVPFILSGTFVAGSSFSNIVLLPANIYGYIIFFNASNPVVQIGQLFTDGSKAYGFSNRIVTNGSSNDDAVELNNSSSTLNLQGRRDDFGTVTVSWRLHYWII